MRRAIPWLVALMLVACVRRDEPPAKPDASVKPAPPAPKIERVVRPAAVAGSWYPGDAKALAKLVDGLLADAKPPKPGGTGPLRALIVPHAGFRYSGPGAAAGYTLLRRSQPRRVVVVGPSHRGRFRGLSIANVTHYRTPLGDIPLDLEAVTALRRATLVRAHDQAHQREHSIEMQLPMLQRVLKPGWTLVPVLVGGMDASDYARAAELLKTLADDRTLFVASGDFTHYGPNYGYVPFPPDEGVATALRDLDMGAYAQIAARSASGFADYRRRTGITACGFGSVSVLLHLVGPSAEPTLLRYYTSGEVGGDYTNSVSYLTVAFTAARPFGARAGPDALPDEQMKVLHGLATRALHRAVNEGASAVRADELVDPATLDPRLRKPSGAFVTLKRDDRLRGCIGHIVAHEPLYRAVASNAVSAALRDRRFRPVKSDELATLDVEVSVLSPLRRVPSYEAFEVGRHGVVLSKHGRRAVYLPEVATEQGWDRAQTLSHLARKAGLPNDAWREGATFELFTSQAFHAKWRAP